MKIMVVPSTPVQLQSSPVSDSVVLLSWHLVCLDPSRTWNTALGILSTDQPSARLRLPQSSEAAGGGRKYRGD